MFDRFSLLTFNLTSKNKLNPNCICKHFQASFEVLSVLVGTSASLSFLKPSELDLRSIWIFAYLIRDDKVWRFPRFVSSIYSA